MWNRFALFLKQSWVDTPWAHASWVHQQSRHCATKLLLIALLLLTGCGGTLMGNNRATLLGAERAENPLSAAEAYMRQYQPGELPRVFQTTRIYDRTGVLIG